jgi:rare lipoprotein A (peptidoglycan hydrolase)
VLALASPALAAQGSAPPPGTPSGGASLTPTTTGLAGSGTPATTSGSATGTGSTTASMTGTNPLVQQGNVPVSGSGAGITLSTTSSAILRNSLNFAGTAPAADAGQTLVIERLGHETNWTWQPTVQTTVNSQGQFSATWSTNHIGEFAMRAVLANASSQTSVRSATTSAAAAAPMVTITIYRPSIATWYGPGFFGQQTACGEKLTRHTLGVANKTLKCGEHVALYYKGKTLVVPVIDRGPYANHADWDLTEATSKALGIEDTVTLGAVSLPTPPASLAIS